MSDLVTDSLMACAEQAGDITDTVYQHFFDACTSAGQLMDHSDEGMRGRMLQQTLELLMDEVGDDEGYLAWEVANHVQAYYVKLDMYPAFFEAIQDAVAGAMGKQWNDEYANAWSEKISDLLEAIEAATPA